MNGGKGTSMQCYPVVWDVSGNVLIIAEPRRADGSEDVTAGGEAKGGGEGRWGREVAKAELHELVGVPEATPGPQ